MTAALDPHVETDHRPEWVGGVVTLPVSVTEGGKTFQPRLIVWLDAATEMVLGSSLASPQDGLVSAGASLRETARDLKVGNPVMPGRVRVATPALAEVLRRDSIEGVEVVCAPTPELDRAIDALLEQLAGAEEERDPRYLRGDATAEGTAAMFRAAARLYRTSPWNVIAHDNHLIGVTSESLGLRDAVVSVIGQAGQVRGFVLFACLDDFHQFGDASRWAHQDGSIALPGNLALTYVDRAEVGPRLLEEIATHRWELAKAAAYPVIYATDQDALARGPTQREMLRIEAIATSLAEIIHESRSELEDAFEGGSRLVLHKELETSGGKLELTISAPHPGQQADNALLDDDGEVDEDRVAAYRIAAYRIEILDQFKASPEAQAEPGAHWAALLVDYATSYFGTTVESLATEEFHELVFEIFPRKVSVEPEAAPAIIAGLRAFLRFLQRERPGSRARGHLTLLEGDASQRLARMLADPSNFGPAKSFIMGGRAAGFDMSSQAGLDAWAAHMRQNNLRLPMGRLATAPLRREPSTSTKQRDARQAKKTKRKAQRAARNKNRSR